MARHRTTLATNAAGEVIDPDAQGVVTLIGVDGSLRVFASLRTAVAELGYHFLREQAGRELHTPRALVVDDRRYWEWPAATFQFVLRNEFGGIVPSEAVRALQPPRVQRWYARGWQQWNGEGPVPGTAKRRGGYKCHRAIHTTPERRLAAAWCPEEGEPAPRGSRNAHNLPNSWDDLPRFGQRNWKKQRKTQWK